MESQTTEENGGNLGSVSDQGAACKEMGNFPSISTTIGLGGSGGSGTTANTNLSNDAWNGIFANDELTMNMENIHGENNTDVSDEERDRIAKEQEEEKEAENRAREQREYDECKTWYRNCGNRYVAPTPQHLVIKDDGSRKYSDENVMKRTSWLGMALGMRSRTDLPEMRRIVIRGTPCITVTAVDPAVARKMLALVDIGPCKVKVIKDPIRNSVSGVLMDFDDFFRNFSEENIEEMLKEEGVTRVQRLGKDESKLYKLAFDSLICPESVKIYEEHRFFRIREYIPPPLRCFNCQKYEHASRSCRNKKTVCQRCGEEGHQNKTLIQGNLVQTCRNERRCLHCGQGHEAGYWKCPLHVNFQKVNELMTLQKISRQEAKARVFPGSGRQTRSDVEVVDASVQLEASRKREQENKAEIGALSAKVDKILEGLQRNMVASVGEESLEEKIQSAVDRATRTMKEDNERQFKEVKGQLAEQKKIVTSLTKTNKKLEDEAKELKLQLAAANADKERLKQQLRDKGPSVQPSSQPPGKANAAKRKVGGSNSTERPVNKKQDTKEDERNARTDYANVLKTSNSQPKPVVKKKTEPKSTATVLHRNGH